MSPAQEQKLDQVLQLTAQHTVLLAGLKEGLGQVVSKSQQLERQVIRIEATRDGRGSLRQHLLSGLSVAIAAISAAVAMFVAFFKN